MLENESADLMAAVGGGLATGQRTITASLQG